MKSSKKLNNLDRSFPLVIILVSLSLPLFLNDTSDSLTYSRYSHLNSAGDIESGGGYIMEISNLTNWIEISDTGFNMTISGTDDGYEVIDFNPQGWNFTFYGTQYDNLFVSANGWMSFTNMSKTSWHVNEIPSIKPENNDSIIPFGIDINPLAGGDIFYQFFNSTPTNYLIIEYFNVVTYEEEDLIGDFEVILYQNGTILFQYKTIQRIYYTEIPKIGLDHGDLLNYNKYTPESSLNSTKIKFDYDGLSSYNCSLNPGEELEWIITELNNSKMESWLGSNWSESLGFPENPEFARKFKVNITSIEENDTDFKIKIDTWNWEHRLDSYVDNPEFNHSLIYKRNPFDYVSDINLTNIFPKVLPSPTYQYLKSIELNSRYSVSGSIDYDDDTILRYQTTFLLNDSIPIWIKGRATYDSDGILEKINFEWENMFTNIEENFFTMERMSEEYLTNFSLNIGNAGTIKWIVNSLNSTNLESILGTNWENLIGIPLNPQQWDKMKVNITDLKQNRTHWNLSYGMWDWIGEKNVFGTTYQSFHHFCLLKDPLNGTTFTNYTNIFPKVIPIPSDIYFEFSDLESGYSKLSTMLNQTWFSYQFDINSSSLRIDARYNHFGILDYLAIIDLTDSIGSLYSPISGERLFSMTRIVEGTIPNYIGIQENQSFEYGFYSVKNASDYGIIINNNTKRRKLNIEYIDGENPDLNRTCILTENFVMNQQDDWYKANETNNYVPGDLHYNFRDINQFAYNFGVYPHYFVANNTNWDILGNELQSLYDHYTGGRYNFTALENGISLSFQMDINQIMYQNFTYTSDGVLNISIVTINGKPILSERLNDFDYLIEPDTKKPVVTILSPQKGDVFGITPPNVSIIIQEDHPDSVWYNLHSSEYETLNLTYTGPINDSIWDDFKNGNITISVYANDTSGNIGYAQVEIIKLVQTSPTIPGPHFFFTLTSMILGVLSLLIIIKKKPK